MKKFDFWVVWLKIVSILFAVFGIVIALLNQTKFFTLVFSDQINPNFWGNTALGDEALGFQQWIYGLLGATCFMLGILIYFIIKNAFEKRQKWAWNCLLMGLVLWFMIDTPISLYFHVYFNVAFNIILLASVLLPLIFTRKEFNDIVTEP